MSASEVSADMAEKVHDLIDGNCVAFVVGYEDRAAVVNGHTDWYTVRAYPDERGVTCDCQASSSGTLCSHAIACMTLWAEARLDPFSGVH